MMFSGHVLKKHSSKSSYEAAAMATAATNLSCSCSGQTTPDGNGGADCKSESQGKGSKPFCYTSPGACDDGKNAGQLSNTEYSTDACAATAAAAATDATNATSPTAAAAATGAAAATDAAAATNPAEATAAPAEATDAQARSADSGQVASRKQVTTTKATMKLATTMAEGLCETQTEPEKTANMKSMAEASGKDGQLDLANSGAACEAGRRRAASKDNFAVTFAFAETVTAAQIKAAIAEVNVKIDSGSFKVSLAVNGTVVEVAITETATQGEKTVTEWVVTYAPNNTTNATTAAPPATPLVAKVPNAGAAFAGSSALATLVLAAALFA